MKTISDLMEAVLAIIPDAVFGEDKTGEIIIATGFVEGENGKLEDLGSDVYSSDEDA